MPRLRGGALDVPGGMIADEILRGAGQKSAGDEIEWQSSQLTVSSAQPMDKEACDRIVRDAIKPP